MSTAYRQTASVQAFKIGAIRRPAKGTPGFELVPEGDGAPVLVDHEWYRTQGGAHVGDYLVLTGHQRVIPGAEFEGLYSAVEPRAPKPAAQRLQEVLAEAGVLIAELKEQGATHDLQTLLGIHEPAPQPTHVPPSGQPLPPARGHVEVAPEPEPLPVPEREPEPFPEQYLVPHQTEPPAEGAK